MKYLGSKNRIAKEILPLMLKHRRPDQYWVEPFVGGANLIDKVEGLRIGADANIYLIALLKELQYPDFFDYLPHIGEEKYKEIQHNKDKFPDWLVGYAGFNLSFGAKFFEGYRRDKAGVRDYNNEAQQNLQAQQKGLFGIDFICSDYKGLEIPPNSMIYCDPPYAKSTGYKNSIDHAEFWQWCRDKQEEGHDVFISEYEAPEDFICIWQKPLNSGGHGKASIEKLFTYL